tara:strand:- start:11522 stop:12181 length:660 start_codon:yes stop_codon:yes gene_type:complete
MKICLITKLSKPHVKDAIKSLKTLSNSIKIYDCEVLNKIPIELYNNEYDVVFSYISSWIIPEKILKNTKKWNINFHPGPPEYPGTGCFNFAIYDLKKEYGATAHLMSPNVDAGRIIKVERFLMREDETVDSLSETTYKYLYEIFNDLVKYIAKNDSLPMTKEKWSRKPYKRSDLEKLATIDIEMSKYEIDLRIRATYFRGKPAPFIKLQNHKFEYNPDR